MHTSKGQGATEYLVLIGSVLVVSLMIVNVLSVFPSSQSSIKQEQSQAYWSSLSPIKVVSSKVVDANLVLGLQNTGTSTLRLDGVSVGGTNLPIYPYYSGDYYGSAYCLRPNDNFSATMTCALMISPGETAYVAAQGAISGASAVVNCTGKASVELADVRFAYSLSGSGITNIPLKGVESMVTSCGTKACDVNWVKVPGNSSLLVNDFCMMKYEAKCSIYNGWAGCPFADLPNSTPANLPWTNINKTNATNRCLALGAGYHLIRDREWVAVASNIANVASNWQNGAVGSGCLYGGHMDNMPLNSLNASTDSDQYYGTGNSAANTFSCPFTYDPGFGKEQRRTYNLSNGQIIWDLSGNVAEWTDGSVFENKTGADEEPTEDSDGITGGQMPYLPSVTTESLTELTGITNFNSLNYSNVSSWNSAKGVGMIYLSPGFAWGGWEGYTQTTHAFVRGGYWYGMGSGAGPWSLYLAYGPSYGGGDIGFRCAR